MYSEDRQDSIEDYISIVELVRSGITLGLQGKLVNPTLLKFVG